MRQKGGDYQEDSFNTPLRATSSAAGVHNTAGQAYNDYSNDFRAPFGERNHFGHMGASNYGHNPFNNQQPPPPPPPRSPFSGGSQASNFSMYSGGSSGAHAPRRAHHVTPGVRSSAGSSTTGSTSGNFVNPPGPAAAAAARAEGLSAPNVRRAPHTGFDNTAEPAPARPRAQSPGVPPTHRPSVDHR